MELMRILLMMEYLACLGLYLTNLDQQCLSRLLLQRISDAFYKRVTYRTVSVAMTIFHGYHVVLKVRYRRDSSRWWHVVISICRRHVDMMVRYRRDSLRRRDSHAIFCII